MNRVKRKCRAAGLILWIFILAGVLPVQASAKVRLSKTSLTLTAGDTGTLKLKGTKKKPKWSSSKKSVAQVNKSGVVTAQRKGTAVITAALGKKKYKCKVKVKAAPELVLSSKEISMKSGTSARIAVTSDTKENVIWGSTDSSLISVNSSGVVTAHHPGTAYVIAATQKTKMAAFCKVTVTTPAVSPQAEQFVRVLQKFSEDIQAERAAGNILGYSNSGSITENTFSDTLAALKSKRTCYTNCAHMVRMALRELGYLENSQTFYGLSSGEIKFSSGTRETLELHCEIIQADKSPEQLLSEENLLPGDICTWRGMQHTNVYAGNNKWYDAGHCGDGKYIKVSTLKKKWGIPAATLTSDAKKDSNLKSKVFVFNNMGPTSSINMKTRRVAYIIRIVK